MKKGRSLLSLQHEDMKDAIVRLLKRRVANGGRGSIKRTVLQSALTKSENLDAVLGNARQAVETKINTAIKALRQEKTPRLDKDRKDGMVRLSLKK